MADWFERAFGATEPGVYESARAMFRVERDNTDDATLISLPNSNRFHLGYFETPSVHELKSRCQLSNQINAIRFENITGDVRALHESQPNAVFQVASQFNALEMVNYDVTPEDGVTGYAFDRTQGPACALCCPAATVYRNYLVNGMGQGGLGSQLDLLSDVAALVGNTENEYWRMQNGYCMPCDQASIVELSNRIESDSALAARLLDALRVGVHWSTQVGSGPHRVTQVFCSALPVSYTRTPPKDWRAFAIQVLKGAYQATLAVAAVLARRRNTRVSVYLTALGGGAFGNPIEWIAAALDDSIAMFASCPLDVYLVHYNTRAPAPFAALESKWNRTSGNSVSLQMPTSPASQTLNRLLSTPVSPLPNTTFSLSSPSSSTTRTLDFGSPKFSTLLPSPKKPEVDMSLPATLRGRLQTVSSDTEQVVLLMTGSFNPISRAHISQMLWVRDQLEQNKAAPQRVAAVVFSPSHDRYVKSKIGAELAIPAAHRCELTRLAIDADPRVAAVGENFISVDEFESNQAGFLDFPEVTAALQRRIDNDFPSSKYRVLYVCGADLAIICGLFRHGIRSNKQVYNFIAVARPHYTLPAEAASSPFGHVIEAQPGNEPFSPKQKSQTSNTDSISDAFNRIRAAIEQRDYHSLCDSLCYSDCVFYMQQHKLMNMPGDTEFLHQLHEAQSVPEVTQTSLVESSPSVHGPSESNSLAELRSKWQALLSSELKEPSRAELAQKLKLLQAFHDSLEVKNVRLNANNAELVNERDAIDLRCRGLAAALSAAEATVRRLEEDLEEKEGQVRLLIDQCHRSDRQVAEVMGERDAAAAALAEETQRATQMQAEFVKATNQIKSLHSDLNIQRQAAVAAAETAEQKFNEQKLRADEFERLLSTAADSVGRLNNTMAEMMPAMHSNSEQLAAAEQKGKAEAALQAELIQQQEFVSLLTTDPGLWTLKYNAGNGAPEARMLWINTQKRVLCWRKPSAAVGSAPTELPLTGISKDGITCTDSSVSIRVTQGNRSELKLKLPVASIARRLTEALRQFVAEK